MLGQDLIQGYLISSRYRPNKKQQVYQIQAVYPLTDTQVLIFTMSSPHAFNDTQWTRPCCFSNQRLAGSH